MIREEAREHAEEKYVGPILNEWGPVFAYVSERTGYSLDQVMYFYTIAAMTGLTNAYNHMAEAANGQATALREQNEAYREQLGDIRKRDAELRERQDRILSLAEKQMRDADGDSW